ncbi:endonuclease [Aurantibacter sp.]|uniref:endonuclease n=1 Tax=Aurantibacter sp. TaxID=2807103 RepID=UPI0035C7902F
MKKKYFLVALLGAFNIALAQIPAGYYNSAIGSGYTLKTQLKDIIDDNNDGLSPEYQSIQLSYGDLYDTYELSDVDIYYDHSGPIPASNKPLLDMYSEKPSEADSYEYIYGSAQQDDGMLGNAEGQRFNREHTIPNSVFGGSFPERSDAHFVIPADKYINAQRNITPYGETNAATQNFTNGTKIGPSRNADYTSGYTNTVFEPIDEFKGDIARIYFYFVTRYEDDLTSYGSYDMFDGTANQAIAQPFLETLYNWHIQDPVSQREIDRNNAIFTQHNNRNPFIDNPSYVYEIWQNVLSTNNFNLDNNSVSIYPNPVTNNVINISSNKNLDVIIYNVLGQNILSTKTTPNANTINLENLNSGVYIVKLKSDTGTTTKQLIKK